MEIELANWSGRRVGGFMSWPAVPGRPRRVAARSDGRRRVAPHGGDFLKPVRYCSIDSANVQRLTVRLDDV